MGDLVILDMKRVAIALIVEFLDHTVIMRSSPTTSFKKEGNQIKVPLIKVGLFQNASLLKILDDREIGEWGNGEIKHNLLKNKPR